MPDGNLRQEVRIRMRRWMWPPGSVSYKTHGGHSSHLASEWHPPPSSSTQCHPECNILLWRLLTTSSSVLRMSINFRRVMLSLWWEQAMCGFNNRPVCTHEHMDSLSFFFLRTKYLFSSWPEIKLNVDCHICFHPIKSKFFFPPRKDPVGVHSLSKHFWI